MNNVILGNSLSDWLLAAGFIFLGVLIGRVAAGLLKGMVKRLGNEFLVTVADESSAALTLGVTLAGVSAAVESLTLPARISHLSGQAIVFVFVLALTWLVSGLYEALHKRVFVPYAGRSGGTIDLHLITVLRSLARALIWFAGLASALNSVGFEVTAVLAGMGIGGVALAMASQDTVANLFGGLIVLTQRPFKAGERIEVAGVNGWVQKIGLRTTTVTNWYGRTVQIPNKVFTDGVVTNIDSQGCYYQEARLRIEPWTPPVKVEEALDILRQIVDDNDLLLKTGWAALDKVDPAFLELEFWYAIAKWSADEKASIGNEYEKICQAKTQVNLAVLRRFEQAGIRFALLPMKVEVKASANTLQPA